MKTPIIEVYQGRDSLWFWHLIATNGKVIADGAEGYDKKSNAMAAVRTVRRTIPLAKTRSLGEAA